MVLGKVRAKIEVSKCEEHFGNARSVRKIFDEAVIAMAQEGICVDKRLRPEHIVIENTLPDLDELRNELDSMIGMDDVKKRIIEITDTCKYNMMTGRSINSVGNIIFTGNAGTGKTTVARILGSMLYEIGAVRSPKFVTANAVDIKSRYVGGAADAMKRLCKKAMGGVLFIDEAYLLGEGSDGNVSETVGVLLDVMENKRDELLVILAGYEKDMNKFLELNQGLSSRIPQRIHFSNYNEEELVEIFLRQCDKHGFRISDDALCKVRELIRKEMMCDDFANARSIRSIFESVYRQHAVNCIENGALPEDGDEEIEAEDIEIDLQEGCGQISIGFC